MNTTNTPTPGRIVLFTNHIPHDKDGKYTDQDPMIVLAGGRKFICGWIFPYPGRGHQAPYWAEEVPYAEIAMPGTWMWPPRVAETAEFPAVQMTATEYHPATLREPVSEETKRVAASFTDLMLTNPVIEDLRARLASATIQIEDMRRQNRFTAACAAMQGMLAREGWSDGPCHFALPERAVEIADHLLSALEPKGEPSIQSGKWGGVDPGLSPDQPMRGCTEEGGAA